MCDSGGRSTARFCWQGGADYVSKSNSQSHEMRACGGVVAASVPMSTDSSRMSLVQRSSPAQQQWHAASSALHV